MERYLLQNSHGPGHRQDSDHAAGQHKMVPSPSSSHEGDIPPAQQLGEAEGICNVAPWDSQSRSQTTSQPLVDYKQLTIEVAMRIASDLQETLEKTIQSTLLKMQADINAYAGRLLEL